MELSTAAFDTSWHATHYFTGVGWNAEPQLVITPFMQLTCMRVSDGTLNLQLSAILLMQVASLWVSEIETSAFDWNSNAIHWSTDFGWNSMGRRMEP